MILRDGLSLPKTFAEGGNGVNSLELSMGQLSPERYEAGTLCTPAIAGLMAGVEFIKSIGISTIASHEELLWSSAYDRLTSIGGLTVYDRIPGSVLLFNLDSIPADELGKELSRDGFCLRTGYHCSPLAHRSLDTPEGGALRIGFGIFNTLRDVDALYEKLKSIAT